MIPTISPEVLQPLTALQPVLAAVASAALKGAILVAIAYAAASTLLRHHSAAARHALWTGVVAAHLVLVVAAPLLPAIALPAPDLPTWLGGGVTRESPGVFAAFAPDIGVGLGAEGGVSAGAVASTTAASPEIALASSQAHKLTSPVAASDGSTQLSTVWALGLLLVLARLLLGTIRVLTLARAAERVTDPAWLALAQRIATRLRLARPLTLLRGDRLGIPVTWGVVYPIVLLPVESDEWPEERRRVVLVHEMAHVKRLDALTQLVGQLAAAIFWFDPLVWLAVRRMRAERERACDDYVIRDGTRPSQYANELLDIVRHLGGSRLGASGPAFAALAMARRSELEGRMLAILDPIAKRHALSRVGSFAATLVALILVVPLAAVRPVDARPHDANWSTSAAFAPPTTIAVAVPVERERAAVIARAAASAFAAATASAGALASTTSSASGSVSTWAMTGPTSQGALPIRYRCTEADVRSTNSSTFSMHSNTDGPGRTFVEYYVKKYGRCVHVLLVGPVTFTADQRDIASLGEKGLVRLHERTLDRERLLVVTRDENGRLQRTYTVDGRPAPYDATAQDWVARLMQDLARETGAGAPARVSQIRARGGVPAVLNAIDEIESVGAKRKHYEALLESGGLSAGEVDLIVRHAGRELATSSGDLRAVLQHVPATNARAVTSALEEAIPHMSDGDRQQVLIGMLDNADAPTLALMLRLAERIDGDGDKATFLQRAVPRVLAGNDPALREAFFRTYATIGADGDKHNVLLSALRQAQKSPALTRDILRAAARIGADGEKATVLLAVARDRLLVTDDLRDEYIKAARTIGSDGDYRRVIDAVLVGKGS
jgi:beta-lactamase regulating signal transducer with metallopeptidase domain